MKIPSPCYFVASWYPPPTIVTQLNALICTASCNFSPTDFRRGNDYGGSKRLRVWNNNYCCLAKSSKRAAAYKALTATFQHFLLAWKRRDILNGIWIIEVITETVILFIRDNWWKLIWKYIVMYLLLYNKLNPFILLKCLFNAWCCKMRNDL